MIFLLFVLATLSLSMGQPCVINGQRDALRIWAANLNAPAWTNSSGWTDSKKSKISASNTEHCSWYGVTCSGGLVTHLSLRSNNVNGTSLGGLASNDTQESILITEAIGCSLQSLILEGNLLTGALPNITLLPSLKMINVANNQLTGTIPEGIGTMSFIEFLDFSVNSLTGPLPASTCGDSLLSLSLAHNSLTGAVDISSCNNLILLDVSDNVVTGSLVTPADNRLSIIHLSETGIDDITEAFESKQLVVLSAFSANISGTIPYEVDNLRSLYSLSVFADVTALNSLSGIIPSSLLGIPSLHDVDLSNNFCNGTLPGTTEAYSLVSLAIRNNCLSGSIPSSLVSTFNSSASILDLRMNYLSCCGIGPLQDYDPDASCGGSQVWYNSYNLSAPRLPPGLKFSSILGPVIQPLGSSFSNNNSWIPNLGNTSYPGLSCPFILPEDAEDKPENFLNWALDPEYSLFEGCKCGSGLVTIRPVFNNLTLMQCIPPSLESSTTSWWIRFYWIFIIIGFFGFALILLVVWLATRGYRSTVVKMFLDAQRRAKGQPSSGLISIVLTDVEGFSKLMRASPELTMQAMMAHNNIIQKAKFSSYGFNLEQEGDSFILLFEKAADAVGFCLQAQQMLAAHKWPKGLIDTPLPRQSASQLQREGSGDPPREMFSSMSGLAHTFQKATTTLSTLWFRSRQEAVLEEEEEEEEEEDVEGSRRGGEHMPPDLSKRRSLVNHPWESKSKSNNSLHAIANAPSSRNSPANESPIDDPRLRQARGQGPYSQMFIQGGSDKDSPNGSTEHKISNPGQGNISMRSPSDGLKRKNVIKGLRVRMGVATGVLALGSSPQNSHVMEMARAVGEAGAGGQILMCSRTFQEIKEMTGMLGRVTEDGLGDEDGSGENKGSFWNSLFFCSSASEKMNDAIVIDMGEYLYYPKGSKIPLLFHPRDFETSREGLLSIASMALYEDFSLNDRSRRGGKGMLGKSRSKRQEEGVDVVGRVGSHSSMTRQLQGAVSRAGAGLKSLNGGPMQESASKAQIRVYQILSPRLLNRARYFGTRVGLKEDWLCVEGGYFSAPGVYFASLGPKDKLSSTLLPSITSVFLTVEGGKVFSSKSRQDAHDLDLAATALIKSLLRLIPGGFFAKHLGGELRYILSFDTPEAALYWAVVFQSTAIYWDAWPASSLKHWPEVVDVSSGELLFRGPRFKIGVCSGVPQSILPDFLGKPDYLGPAVNNAARFSDVAAHGGQVVCEEEVAMKVLESWSKIAQPFFNEARERNSNVSLLPMPPSSTHGVNKDERSSSGAMAAESYDKIELAEPAAIILPPLSSQPVGGSNQKLKHASFMVPGYNKGNSSAVQTPSGRDSPQLSTANSSVRASPFAGVLTQVSASGSSFTGGHPLKSAMRQTASGAAHVPRENLSTVASSYSIMRSGGSLTAMTRMDPNHAAVSAALTRRSFKEIEEVQPAQGGQDVAVARAVSQRLLSMGTSMRSMSGLRPSSIMRASEHGKEWFLPSRTLLHKSESMTVVVNRLGTFSFEGCPEPLQMVDLTTSDLVMRRYPLSATKGKGSRLAVGEGEAGRVQLPVLKVVGELKERFEEASMIRVGDIELGSYMYAY